MGILQIAPATRAGSFVLLSVTGPSGSGKTMTAIKIARGLVGPSGKIGFLDTETRRGRLYSDVTPFDYAELTPPFSPKRYMDAIDEFEATKVDVIIVDSGSHEWEGTGGVQELAEATGKQGLLKWAKPKEAHKKFVNRLLAARCHIIICLRARERLVQTKDGQGRDQIVSAGYHEIAEKNFIYEMTASVLLLPGGRKVVTKCPAPLVPVLGEVGTESTGYLNEDTGRKIAEWVSGGTPVNHDAEALRRKARETAEGGVHAFREWFKALPADQRAIVNADKENLQSIAEAADAMAQSAREGGPVAYLDDGTGNDPLVFDLPDAAPEFAEAFIAIIDQTAPEHRASAWLANSAQIPVLRAAGCTAEADRIEAHYRAVNTRRAG